jgi:hypothetical protein
VYVKTERKENRSFVRTGNCILTMYSGLQFFNQNLILSVKVVPTHM